MGMFDGLFGGSNTRQKQLDKQEAEVMHHDAHAAKQHPHMAPDGKVKHQKSQAEKDASQSIQDWINSGR